MDKKGIIAEHSKAKLALYSRYLQSYLGVLFNAAKFNSIAVHDIFAGSGMSANDEKGSALLAAEVIGRLDKSVNAQRKAIGLKLNDADANSVDQLKKHLKDCAFAEFQNVNADVYIDGLVDTPGQHCLFFIDPHGYTQISPSNLKKLFSWPRSDLLLFVPLSHVWRFLRHEDQSEQMRPIARFLHAFGVDESSAKNTSCLLEFAIIVKSAIGSLASGNAWVTKQLLRNQSNGNSYCLFFVTKNILGAQKFLEARERSQPDSTTEQMGFEFVEELEQDQKYQSFKSALQPGSKYDNVSLYELGIRHDLRPTDVNDVLTAMEELGRVVVVPIDGMKRRGRAFYIGYDYHKKSDRRITVALM